MSTDTATSPDNAARVQLSDQAIRSVIIGLMLAILLGALDQTIVSVALPRISEQLHGFGLLAWVVSGYLVASTVATPIYGKLGDLFGRRRMLSIGITLFLIASVLCALAQTMPQLVIARVLQGLGGGGLISVAQAIIADVVPLRERGRFQGYISGVYAVASVAGPVVGGVLTHYLNWRWIFWINLPLGLAAFLVSRRALASLPVPGIKKPIDFFGAALLSAGLSALLIAITRVGQGVVWNAPDSLALFAASVVVLVAFIYWETKAVEPIVPLHLFKIPLVGLCCAVVFLAFFQLISLSVLMPLRFQMTAELTADQSALRLVPLSLMIPVGAFLAGRLMLTTGRYRPIQITGAMLVPPALLALAFVDPRNGLFTSLCMALGGVGIGLQLPTSLVAVQNAVPSANLGIATAATAFFRSMGGAIGIAVLSAILLATLGQGAQGLANLHSGSDMLHEMIGATLASADDATRATMREVAENAFRTIFIIGAIIALIPIALAFFVPDKNLGDRKKS